MDYCSKTDKQNRSLSSLATKILYMGAHHLLISISNKLYLILLEIYFVVVKTFHHALSNIMDEILILERVKTYTLYIDRRLNIEIKQHLVVNFDIIQDVSRILFILKCLLLSQYLSYLYKIKSFCHLITDHFMGY